MLSSSAGTRKKSGHETTIRSVVDHAFEVRILLQDKQVIFGTVAHALPRDTEAFCIQPWGVTSSLVIRFDDVRIAAPVKQMHWAKQRAITAAQHAGTFSGPRKA